ncbi:MAG: alanine racemase [Bacilli bacterium]|nr:alanine racemase [Bacilli bacterium]
MQFYRPTWAEIDLDQFTANLRCLQNYIGENRQVLAVVKGNAYGHGAVPMAAAAMQAGASYLGVASLDEAIELRDGGIVAPILLMGAVSHRFAEELVHHEITQSVFTNEMLLELAKAARNQNKTAKIHVELDTGMGRFGLRDLREAVEFIERAVSTPGIHVEGIFTHLATAEDPNFDYALYQYGRWQQVLKLLKERGFSCQYEHLANSAAGMQHLYMISSLVRFGLALYGIYPAPHLKRLARGLASVLRLVSEIIFLQTHPAGSKISYGGTYTTKEGARIAIVPIGTADGLSPHLSNKGYALVRGIRAPIVGAVCMNHLMLDVSHITPAAVGDQVVLFGQQNGHTIGIDEVARWSGVKPHEVLGSLNSKVPRVYLTQSEGESNEGF